MQFIEFPQLSINALYFGYFVYHAHSVCKNRKWQNILSSSKKKKKTQWIFALSIAISSHWIFFIQRFYSCRGKRRGKRALERERESNKASIALLTLINSQLICTNFRFTRCKTRGSINPYFMTFYYEYLRSTRLLPRLPTFNLFAAACYGALN